MLKALLALLLLRADASSYGFSVAWNSDSSLVHHARGYAANVVNISMNDLTTMRNTEVLCPSMDNLSTHTHDGNRALLTTPLHASQLEEVHPRGPAVLTNMPDNNTNTTGQNPLSTTDDQPPRLDHDTSHYTNTNANAICVVTTFYSKSNDTGDGHNEDHNTEPPPSAICAVLDAVINEYQYYVHKPPPDCVQHGSRRSLPTRPRCQPPRDIPHDCRGLRFPGGFDGHSAIAPIPTLSLPVRAGVALCGRFDARPQSAS